MPTGGISLGDVSAVFIAVGTLLAGVFTFFQFQSNAAAKVAEGRVNDLQKQLDRLTTDSDERAAELRKDFERQLTDVKQAMANQAQTIHRQQLMLDDYARHVSKLERIMYKANLKIPDFETSRVTGGTV